MSKVYLGIDNGVSGAIGRFERDGTSSWLKIPVRSELNYTKKKANITRIDVVKLRDALWVEFPSEALAVIERPMVNPGRFGATISAVRCLEATLIVLEELKIPYQYIDSKEWQKTQLPSGLEGPELKQASLDIGRRMWPNINFKPDADAMLIARHAMLKNL